MCATLRDDLLVYDGLDPVEEAGDGPGWLVEPGVVVWVAAAVFLVGGVLCLLAYVRYGA